jgi:hypothetical protein
VNEAPTGRKRRKPSAEIPSGAIDQRRPSGADQRSTAPGDAQ